MSDEASSLPHIVFFGDGGVDLSRPDLRFRCLERLLPLPGSEGGSGGPPLVLRVANHWRGGDSASAVVIEPFYHTTSRWNGTPTLCSTRTQPPTRFDETVAHGDSNSRTNAHADTLRYASM
eukprot:GHVU01110439.1.p2 GENE.GHVU01110439.1~~GHVU01110439.1.p2  ORF type:complete len:121 (-),score=9.44 GHVU01110439.1:207-569(-)